MGVMESKKMAEPSQAPSVPVDQREGAADDFIEEKSVHPLSEDNKLSHPNSPPLASSNVQDSTTAKSSAGSFDRDARLARVSTDKKMALIKAWEESERTKADNKSYKKQSVIGSWENSKRASLEAQLTKIEVKLEKKKAAYAENMQNKIAKIHKTAAEKKAMVEAKRGKDFLKVEEAAAKFRTTGHAPKKFLGCF